MIESDSETFQHWQLINEFVFVWHLIDWDLIVLINTSSWSGSDLILWKLTTLCRFFSFSQVDTFETTAHLTKNSVERKHLLNFNFLCWNSQDKSAVIPMMSVPTRDQTPTVLRGYSSLVLTNQTVTMTPSARRAWNAACRVVVKSVWSLYIIPHVSLFDFLVWLCRKSCLNIYIYILKLER